jgi:acetyl-CoA synthetase
LADPERASHALQQGHYRTGDIARRDPSGHVTYVGRNDDVFKCSDYRISPFELESMLIEHNAVVEAAVVPSPDVQRQFVPKAFVTITRAQVDERAVALSIFLFVRDKVAPFKRIRRLEFRDLPKTISGKIRRVELRGEELQRGSSQRRDREFWEEDFPELNRARVEASPLV